MIRRSSSAWPRSCWKYSLSVISATRGAGGAQLEDGAAARMSSLSSREREVALLIARGLTNRQIAEELIIGERTAEGHVDHIRDKLGVRNRAEIAVWVVQHVLS